MAERTGCEVLGIDLSAANVAQAGAQAARRGLAARARFAVADAEALQCAAASFDALLCECAWCTFPDKAAAAAEFQQVLKPAGRLAISDLTRVAAPLPQLDGLLAWVACIADAQPLERYAQLLRAAGFEQLQCEERSACLRELVQQVRGRLALLEVLIGLGKLEAPGLDVPQARATLLAADAAIRAGELGYAVLLARRPPAP